MEIVLIILLFIYLIITLSNIQNKLKENEKNTINLHKKLNELIAKKEKKGQETKTQETKPNETIFKPIETKVEPPIVVEKEIPDPSFVIENSKKIVFEVERKPIIQQDKKPNVIKKSWWENFKEKNPDLEKFIGENLINKIGVLILVLGVSYFVKYSIDKGWISEEARVGIGILSGAMVLGIAHKLRAKYAAFSSVFVAGAIAIFYFTIAIAFHDYKLFNQSIAFTIMVMITIFSCVISILYNRKELAVLSLIGGFAVPFMVSTGAGNYKVLFTYILILNSGILGIAYFKRWNIINILAFIFTILLFGGWFIKDIQIEKPHYLGALVFGFLFYLLFVAMNIINNLRTKGVFTNLELFILSSNTFLFYSLGMVALHDFHPELRGVFTTGLGILNLIYALILYKKFGLDKKAVYLLIGLTLTFVTLAIPIQFKGNYITLFWAAEAVLLLWLGIKSKITLYKFGSVIVTVLMFFSLILDWINMNSFNLNYTIIFNKIFITGLFSIITLIIQRYLLKSDEENSRQFGFTFNPIDYSGFLKIVCIILAYIVGFLEVNFQSNSNLISNNSSASIVIVYHLIFCLILFIFSMKSNKIENIKFAKSIGILNILLGVFWFSNYPFFENKEILEGKTTTTIAFILHYLVLAIIIFFSVSIYKKNKEKELFSILNSPYTIWFVAFLIVFISSTELMLHGLKLGIDPITDVQVLNNKLMKDYNGDKNYVKSLLVNQDLYSIRNLIVRTGYPILWGLLAFVFLIFGIKYKNKVLRIVALTLLGITIVKLFLFDIKNVSVPGKIVTFILLGVLILIISFVYQKIKVLVIEDKPIENDKNDKNE